MTPSTHRRKFHFKNKRPNDPAVKSLGDWLPANRGFYADFRRWLREGGYSDSALNTYGTAARIALGWLDLPYWQIAPLADLDRVRDYIVAYYESEGTRISYLKGIAKLAEYLCLRCHQPLPRREANWSYHLDPLPAWLAEDVRAYVTHRSRTWLPEERRKTANDLLSHLTRFLRWAAAHAPLTTAADFTPVLWFDYVDVRLAAGIKPTTLNGELLALQAFLQFVADLERPVCPRMLRVETLKEGPRLPRDVPPDQLRRLMAQIEAEAAAAHAGIRRMGVMDRAWFLLMLHCGLRTGEVRRLRMADLNLAERRVRIEQSKGLKDRVLYLSPDAVEALWAYLDVRGPADGGPHDGHVFTYRHLPLSYSYCYKRLLTYGKRCGLHVTPHQLRHTCATLLLNAGAPILTVQVILGHKYIDTTLGYARLYDGTVAADYYRAMAVIERRLAPAPHPDAPPPTSGQLLALVDALSGGALNEVQRETVGALRAGILALAEATGGV